jgi:phosphoenolpyruvate phosphomutase
MRAAVAAMQETCRQLYATRSAAGLQVALTSVKEIFALLDYEALEKDEQLYLLHNSS